MSISLSSRIQVMATGSALAHFGCDILTAKTLTSRPAPLPPVGKSPRVSLRRRPLSRTTLGLTFCPARHTGYPNFGREEVSGCTDNSRRRT